MIRRQTRSTLFPYTTLFRSEMGQDVLQVKERGYLFPARNSDFRRGGEGKFDGGGHPRRRSQLARGEYLHESLARRSEEHTSELQSLAYLVCRLLLEKKKIQT